MNINAYAIINADNDTIARYDTMEEANAELAYFTDDYCVVDWYAFFHHYPAARVEDRIQYAQDLRAAGSIEDRIEANRVADELRDMGLKYEHVFGKSLF